MFYKIIAALIILLSSTEVSALIPKKHNLSICALFTNEAKYLKEWIEYHRLIGVDHFYLYDNNSKDRYKNVLAPYIKKGIVTLVSWPDYYENHLGVNAAMWALSTKATAYENAVRIRAPRETKWLAIIDVDEFLVPLNEMKLAEILEKYDEYPGIVLSRNFYDASKKSTLPKKKLLIETADMTNAPLENPSKTVEKMVFKPDLCVSFTWPPFKYLFKNNQTAKKITQIRINEYINRNKGYFELENHKNRLNVDNRILSEEEIKEILNSGFEIEDQERMIYRFIPDLLKNMGYDTY